MINRPLRLKFNQLPSDLQTRLNAKDFLQGREAPNKRNVVVWMVDRVVNKQIELEWDPATREFLDAETRLAASGKPPEATLPSAIGTVRVDYTIDQDTGSLMEEVVLVSTTGSELVRTRQQHYSPVRMDISKLVEEAVAKSDFPREYSSWPLEQRINYWVAALYRLRRSVGETGNDENNAFGMSIVEKMRATDPHVDKILRLIVQALAAMEGIPPAELVRQFSLRTGIPI